MKKALALFGLAALGLLAYRQATAAPMQAAPTEQGASNEWEWLTYTAPVSNWWDQLTPAAFAQLEAEAAPQVQAIEQAEQVMQADRNVRAFLTAIAMAEGTEREADPYRVCYGYKHTLSSFADHPAITGEWRGERLSDAHCRGAGLSPGCVSTAAGRYQIIRPTWATIKARLKLPDFSPESQDLACIALIQGRGALADVQAGRFAQAVEKCRKEWASLPGANYGQGERTLPWLQARYAQAGGVLA